MRAGGLRSCRSRVRERIAHTAALVEIGCRGERQGAAAGTGITILVLTESLRTHNVARNTRSRCYNLIL